MIRLTTRVSRTFPHIPSQVSQSEERVEGERQREKCLSGVLDGIRKSSDIFYHMSAVEGPGCDKVGDGEPVQH